MKPLPLAQIRSIVGGSPLTSMPVPGTPLGELFVRSVCTDTRKIEPGCLFAALVGETYDAHEFVPKLTAGTAICALVEKELPSYPVGVWVLLVPSVRAAMGKLASHIRSSFTSSVIAVGGSNGKTSTKHLIDAALRCRLTGTISEKSFNNDIGVPKTVFAHDPNMDYLVLEMGTNHHGELQVLSDMAKPDVAVITSISHEHLEGLGDLNGVRKEEAAILSGLSPKGLLVVNGDDQELMPFLSKYPGKRVTFGFGTHNDLFATNVRLSAEGVRFNVNGNPRREVFVPLLGKHTATNALAAIAVARRLGLNEDEVIASLATANGPEMRQELKAIGGVQVLNDAYNANPASFAAAFETFFALPTRGRRVAVIGEMRELGDTSDDLHRELGKTVTNLPLDYAVFVGAKAKLALESSGLPSGMAMWYPTSEAAANAVKDLVEPGDLMLLKGSRGVRLEVIAKGLMPAAASMPMRAMKVG